MNVFSQLAAVLLFYLGTLTLSLRAQTDNRTEIHVAFITSFGEEYNSSGSIPAVQLATELINNRSYLLSDYKLVIEAIENPTVAKLYADSMCERSGSLSAFLRQVTTGEDKVALLGCGCSTATEPVAEISGFWNITHIAYASSSDTLSNQQRFPNFWRTYPQESNLASSVVAIMREYNWTVLKIITQDEGIFTGSTDTLLAQLKSSNVTVNQDGTTIFTQRDNLMDKDDIFQPEVRVYFLNMYSKHARQVLCAAARNLKENTNSSFYYPGYVWITVGWYRERWWTADIARDSETNCSDEELEAFLPQTLGVVQTNTFNTSDVVTDVSLTAEEFMVEYERRLNLSTYSYESTAFHAYDAVWALGFAINRSLPELEYNGYSLESFQYNTNARNISDIIQGHLQDMLFVGISGDVSFNENGTRVGTDPKILKYRDGSVTNNCGVEGPEKIERVMIAIVNGSEFIYVGCEDIETTWPGRVPSDGTPKVVITGILLPIFYVYTILTSAGIIFAIVCLLFNFIFRKRKIVRLISPNLNYLIIIGAIFMYASVYGYVIPSTDPLTITITCHVRAWLQPVGYYLCFGTIVAKMWRVYYIFHKPFAPKMKGVRDWHLLIIVALLTSVVVVMYICVAIFGDYKATEVDDNETQEQRTEDEVLIKHRNLVCQGPGDTIWIILTMVYIASTQLVAVYFAFRTRKVDIKVMNDAKYISMILYVTSCILTVMIICAIILRDFLNADAATFGALLIAFTTIALALLFIPKMIILYRDPKGERIFRREYSVTQPIPSATNAGSDVAIMDRMSELEKHNQDLKKRLAKYEGQLSTNISLSNENVLHTLPSNGKTDLI